MQDDGQLETFQKRLFQSHTLDELRYTLVNELRQLIGFQHATLLEKCAKKVTAVSDLTEIETTSPFKNWIEKFSQEIASSEKALECFAVTPSNVSTEVRREWPQYSSAHILWVPIQLANGKVETALILTNERPWSAPDQLLARQIAPFMDVALRALEPKRFRIKNINLSKRYKWIIGSLLAFSVFPVKLSVLAPAEVVPLRPYIISAPFEGVVKEILVSPDQKIAKGDSLALMQTEKLESQKALAQNALAVVEAKLLKAQQIGLLDISARSDQSILEAQVKLKQAEVNFASMNLGLAMLTAPIDGISIVQSRSDWQGRPVQVGERILVVADPKAVKVKVMVPVKDAIAIENNADVSIFLDKDPLSPITGKVIHAGFEPEKSSDGTLAFPVTVMIHTESEAPRIGLRGVARIKTQTVALGYYLFRRPLNSARQWIGW